MQNFDILPLLHPLHPTREPLRDLQRPPDAQIHKAMTFGYCISCQRPRQDKTQLKILHEVPNGHKTVSMLICGLQNMFGQFTKPRHFFKSPWCTDLCTPQSFYLLTRKYLGYHRVCYRGVFPIANLDQDRTIKYQFRDGF